MKHLVEVPDKTIEMSHGDRVNIYIEKEKIVFDFFCDNVGNTFEISKKELREMIK